MVVGEVLLCACVLEPGAMDPCMLCARVRPIMCVHVRACPRGGWAEGERSVGECRRPNLSVSQLLSPAAGLRPKRGDTRHHGNAAQGPG